MARTQGAGNPDWTRDETILALDLYLQNGQRAPSKTDARLLKLSNALRALPYHSKDARRDSFRNPDGVRFKILNIRSVSIGRGLSNSEMDRKIWAEFGS